MTNLFRIELKFGGTPDLRQKKMDEQLRKSQNATMLERISPSIRPRVAGVLSDMETRGYRPLIDAEVWRSPAVQMKHFRNGTSHTPWGFHCATTRDGTPDSLAADIVDADKKWGASRDYWFNLIDCALARGLSSGGFFGLKTEQQKQALTDAIDRRDYQAKVALGWDAAHVEVRGLSIADAKAGVRPPLPSFEQPQSPQTPQTAPPLPTLSFGSGMITAQRGLNSDVKKLQTKLNSVLPKFGINYQLTVDGQYGKVTEKWVRTFQIKTGLVPNAVVDERVWAALDEALKQ